MPLLRFDLIKGRDAADVKKLLDTAHDAMVEAFDVPASDRYQVVHQHEPYEMIMEDTGLGYERTEKFVLLSIVSKKRTAGQKQRLYALTAERLASICGIPSTDLMISITENEDADWSFGLGEAQFITGKL
ncbi:tautomerase family protein [Listeria sp. FSL L7-1582]|uniref:tautomerase family protein n=1 Tax=Listeria portnoyi TaxID=2713504 RepID=UPI00164EC9EB|nr:tautomerase family protein [Listeria portnoyi]MBC6310669.1 tautomerase family protein [Listeria portnoyi]